MESCSALCCSAAARRFSSSNLEKGVSHSGAQDAEQLTPLCPLAFRQQCSEFKSPWVVILTFPRAAQRFFGTLPRGPTALSGPFPALFPPGLPCVVAQPPLTIPHLSAGLQHTRWNNHIISIMLLLKLHRTTVHLMFSRPKHLDGTMSPLQKKRSSYPRFGPAASPCPAPARPWSGCTPV